MNNTFDLYREARDYYNRLIPDKSDGLILLSLYKRFGEGDFKEEQINDVIDKTLKDLAKGSSRTEYTRNHAIIIRLQDYFLWRDETNKIYRFKKHGLNFCQLLQKRLEESYSPATIKRWFDHLYKELQEHRAKEDGFVIWINDHFNLRHIELAEQIEILDQQVSESVKEFKLQIKQEHPEGGIHRVLQDIEMQLDTIKEQAEELKTAFRTTYDLDDVLTDMLEKQEVGDNLEQHRRVRTFNKQVRAHFEQVSNRIEKIKPRVREFIFDFNQRDFDRKTGQFLDFLLKHSKSARDESNRRVLLSPPGVTLRLLTNRKGVPDFVKVPLREIGPRMPVQAAKRTINRMAQQKFLQKTKEHQHEKARIRYWSNYAFQQIRDEGSLEFAPLFFRIIREENGNLAIAVRTAHRLLKHSHKKPELVVQIDKVRFTETEYPNTAIWKMHIHQH